MGEDGLVARITERLPAQDHLLVGPGDDAALLQAPASPVATSMDVLVEGRHFRREWSTGYDVGRKAAAANLADIAAMGGTATTLLVGLGCPATLPLTWVEDLVDGLSHEAALTGAVVVGGDVVSAAEVVVSVAVIGEVSGPAVRRSGARPGDILVVVGELGYSAAGLALLDAGRPEVAPEAVRRHRRPVPPYAAGPLLARRGATAMMDISDGLVVDLARLGAASGVGIDLRRDALRPDGDLVTAGKALNVDPLTWLLTGGEEHSLAATLPPSAPVPDEVAGRAVRAVGTCSAGTGVQVDGQRYRGPSGWSHF